jgi:hypothetical protein
MPLWLVRLRDVVWTAVSAVALAIASIAAAVGTPERPVLALSLGLAGVTMGLLATRD